MRRTTPIDPHTAAAIAARRRAAGIPQNALALAIGVSEGTISKIETCRVPVTSEVRAAIERAMVILAQPSPVEAAS